MVVVDDSKFRGGELPKREEDAQQSYVSVLVVDDSRFGGGESPKREEDGA